MRFLNWTEKCVVQCMVVDILSRAFGKKEAEGLYLKHSEVVFSEIENADWFQDGKDILSEYIEAILLNLFDDALSFTWKGEFEKH